MKILFDSNVLLDVLLKRDPWVKEAAKLWRAVEDSDITGHVIASILTDLFILSVVPPQSKWLTSLLDCVCKRSRLWL